VYSSVSGAIFETDQFWWILWTICGVCDRL